MTQTIYDRSYQFHILKQHVIVIQSITYITRLHHYSAWDWRDRAHGSAAERSQV